MRTRPGWMLLVLVGAVVVVLLGFTLGILFALLLS